MDFADVINFSTFKGTHPFLRNAWSQLELNVELNSDCTKDSILIRKDEIVKERILLHKDANPSEEDEKEHISKLTAVDVEHIQGPDNDPKEFLIQPFPSKNSILPCLFVWRKTELEKKKNSCKGHVIDREASQDIGDVGPVSIDRLQTSFEDLQPYLEDIVGFPEIGFTRKAEMMENKRRPDD
ncbi:unnamed protein product [Caenorhabditis nigoni]